MSPPRSERLHWLTGFSGSAGVALVLARPRASSSSTAATRCRCATRSTSTIFTIESLIDNPPPTWIKDNLGKGARLGFDPWLHTIADVKALTAAAEKSGAELVPVDRNPIDELWTDRPTPPLAPVEIHPIDFAGELAKDKLARLAAAIAKDGATHAVLTDPSSIAWAFNIRGGDVPHTPLALGFAILAAEGPHLLFMDKRKLPHRDRGLSDPARRPARASRARSRDRARWPSRRREDRARPGARRRAAAHAGRGRMAARSSTLPIRPACRAPPRTSAEIAGARAAHRRDGAAVAKLLCWLDAQAPGTLDEIAVVDQARGDAAALTGEETQMPLREVSFATIAGAGPNGAIMHYRVSRATNRQLQRRRAVPARFRRRSTRTARPTSPAPCRSASRPRRCASATRWC